LIQASTAAASTRFIARLSPLSIAWTRNDAGRLV
jgi:hypothetical protein